MVEEENKSHVFRVKVDARSKWLRTAKDYRTGKFNYLHLQFDPVSNFDVSVDFAH